MDVLRLDVDALVERHTAHVREQRLRVELGGERLEVEIEEGEPVGAIHERELGPMRRRLPRGDSEAGQIEAALYPRRVRLLHQRAVRLVEQLGERDGRAEIR